MSADQVLVPWPARPLRSREAARVRVRVIGSGVESDWSEPATVEAGLLSPDDWTARFVSPLGLGGLGAPAPILGSSLHVGGPVSRARLYATAHGVYTATLNGRRIGDHVLAPGWTSYHHRLRYQTYDVTDLVREGDNELEVLLGNGWFRGRLGWGDRRAHYGDRLALLAQLEVTTADGAVHVLATDESWTARESGVLADDLYDGQRTDLRPRRGDRRRPGGGDRGDLARLVAPDGPPVRATEMLPAREVFTRAVRRHARRLRPEPRRLGAAARARRRARYRGRDPPRRGARGRRARRAPAAHGEGDRQLHPRRRRRGAASRASPSTASATPRSAGCGRDPRRGRRGRRRAAPTCGAPAGSAPPTSDSTGSTRTSSGACAATSSTCPPTARSATSDSAGPATSRSSPPPPRSCSTPPGSSGRGWPTWRPSRSRTARFRSSCPTCSATPAPAAAGWGDAATLVPWVALPAQRRPRAARAPAPEHARLGRPRRRAGRRRPPVDGRLPVRRLARPDGAARRGRPTPRPTPTSSPRRTWRARPRSWSLAAARARRAGHRASATRRLADRVRDAFAREYVTAGGRVLSDAATVYALALVWSLLPTAEQRRRAGERLADLVRTAGLPHQHRVRRHPADRRRA